MKIDIADLKNKSKREIVSELVEYVVTSEEEFEEKETRSGERTDLNVYLADNERFSIGDLDDWILFLQSSDQASGYAKNFAGEHTFSEQPIDNEISLVRISTPSKEREDEFIFVLRDGFLWVLTTVHSEWRKKTIEPLLEYLPCVERLYLSYEDLEELVFGIEDSRVSGFTAKYHSPHRERNATLQFSGAEDGDLEKAKRTFEATPTRIDFDQKNSPVTAIQGANTHDGRISLRSVVEGSQPKAVETLLGLSEEYQELDTQRFEVDYQPEHEDLGNGFTVNGFTAVEFRDPDREEAESLREEIVTNVLNSHQYYHGIRDGGRKIRVYDRDYDEVFDIALEPPNIILYARKTTTALSLRSFAKNIYELDSTYSIQKHQNPIATR